MEQGLLLDGKATANAVLQDVAARTLLHRRNGHPAPHLVAVLVGQHGPSQTYVANKMKACQRVGFESTLLTFDDNITETRLLNELDRLNSDPGVDGILVQLPLPPQVAEDRVIEHIDWRKDVDGFHPVNMGRLALGLPCPPPATPGGILELLARHALSLEGKHAVVVGRSNIVGTPLALLLSRNSPRGNATVTLCHSKTPNLAHHTRQADVLLVAAGRQGFIGPQHVAPGAVVVDVGIHRVPDPSLPKGYRLAGDVDFAAVRPLASAITPVPGGVGPMTIAQLLLNTLQVFERHRLQLS